MICLVDADILVYQVGYSTQYSSRTTAAHHMDIRINEILDNNEADDYRVFLSDSAGNYRLQLYPEYKGNRHSEHPKHYEYLMNYLVDDYGAQIAWEQEADDLLGITQTSYFYDDIKDNTLICSIDKDLHQIVGRHYNLNNGLTLEIGQFHADYNFYHQLLMGDVVDNIPGIVGCGPVGAAKILKGCKTELEMFEACRKAYNDDESMLLMGRLVRIRRYVNEMWEYPNENINSIRGSG